ncbi:MAG: hypothetical protein J6Y89_07835, partial [Lachnospiraceae bacterium]|nr:hypothetical protein [Lachnospiraceae bacterium]
MSRSAHVNNKGSALVAVIISMLFIGIIAAIVLSLTRSNLSNSESNKNSSSNFYQGEVYMDELRSELKKLAEVAKKSAYEKWLKSYVAGYSEMSSTDQESKFYELFAEEFQKLIDTTTISKEYDVLDADVNGTGTPLSSADIEIEREDGEIKGIIIKGISLTREDEQGDITTISTDLSLTFQIPPVS